MEIFFGWPVWLLVILQHFHSQMWVCSCVACMGDGLQWTVVGGPSRINGQNKTEDSGDVKFLRTCFDSFRGFQWACLLVCSHQPLTFRFSENIFPFTGDLAGKFQLIEPHWNCFVAFCYFEMNFGKTVITFKVHCVLETCNQHTLGFTLMFPVISHTHTAWRLWAFVCNSAIWWPQSYMHGGK